MVSFTSFSTLAFAAYAAASPVAGPQITPAPASGAVDKRATSCTFSGSNGAASASKSQASCATIVLSDVAVPSGTTLDLSKLNDGTKVSREQAGCRGTITNETIGHLRGRDHLGLQGMEGAPAPDQG